MKKIFAYSGFVLLSLFSFSSFANTKTIENYEQLQKALAQGDNVFAIIHFERCKPKGHTGVKEEYKNQSDQTSRVNFSIYSHYFVNENGNLKYTIATSNTIFTEMTPPDPKEKPILVNAYSRLRIYEDNTSWFHTGYYDVKTYEKKGGLDLICSVGTDNQSGVTLFDASV